MPLTCYVCVCVNACVWRICKEKKQTHINMGNIVYVCASVPFLWIWGLDSKGSGHWNVFIWFAFCLPITQRTPPRILSLQEKNAPYFHRSCYGSKLEELFNLDSCGFFFSLKEREASCLGMMAAWSCAFFADDIVRLYPRLSSTFWHPWFHPRF